jgi:hypothetical protein
MFWFMIVLLWVKIQRPPRANAPDGLVIVVDGLRINNVAPVHADLPGANFIAGRKALVEPQTSVEDLGMVALVKVYEQIGDILPQASSHDRITFQVLNLFPIRDNQFVNVDKGRALVFCPFKYLLKSMFKLLLAGDALGCQVSLTLFFNQFRCRCFHGLLLDFG